MKPEIRRYLQENAATYTTEAMRRALLEAGQDPSDVDDAMRVWHIEQSGGISDEDRRAYRRWSASFHVGALVAVLLLGFVLIGADGYPIVLIGAVVLALFLGLGWALSSVIAAVVLPRTNLAVALVVPAVFALGLGGTCLALLDGLTPTPPLMGTMDVRIDGPVAFEGAGTAFCAREIEGDSFSVGSENLGTIDGRWVAASVDRFDMHGDPNAPGPTGSTQGSVNMYIALNPTSGSQQPVAYTVTPDTQLEVEVAPGGLSGTVGFAGLTPEPMGAVDPAYAEPISGSISWECE